MELVFILYLVLAGLKDLLSSFVSGRKSMNEFDKTHELFKEGLGVFNAIATILAHSLRERASREVIDPPRPSIVEETAENDAKNEKRVDYL